MIQNLWKYRYLTRRLAVTEFKIRYKNSVLGILWSLLEPLLLLLVLYIVFAYAFPSTQENYHLFILIGIVMWDFFAKGTSMSLNSIITRPGMIRQVYVPREVLIFSSSLAALMMTVLELAVFFLFMLLSLKLPTITILYFPVVLIMYFVLIFGLSLALGSLNTYYRDVQYIWAVVLQAGFFASGIFFDISTLPGTISEILMLNPVAIIILLSRDSLLYSTGFSLSSVVYCLIVSLTILIIGYLIFLNFEPGFAEEV